MYKAASLLDEWLAVIQNKGTERPFTGEYHEFHGEGTYLCRQCGLALFHSSHKFHSGCGWPSFDDALPNALKRQPDRDGMRVEILCARCDAHLGHVFEGEKLTQKNLRHCVNSVSLDYVHDLDVVDTEEAIFAAGCFWGVEYYFKQLPGVIKTQVGYSGGHTDHPNYRTVCDGGTGHYEVIRVVYDKAKLDFKAVAKFFFEIHDFCQGDGQGPDIGEQYLSVLFYYDDAQKYVADTLIAILKDKDYAVSTKILPVTTFWPAERDHQDYYRKTGKQPYCHTYTKVFD